MRNRIVVLLFLTSFQLTSQTELSSLLYGINLFDKVDTIKTKLRNRPDFIMPDSFFGRTFVTNSPGQFTGAHDSTNISFVISGSAWSCTHCGDSFVSVQTTSQPMIIEVYFKTEKDADNALKQINRAVKNTFAGLNLESLADEKGFAHTIRNDSIVDMKLKGRKIPIEARELFFPTFKVNSLNKIVRMEWTSRDYSK